MIDACGNNPTNAAPVNNKKRKSGFSAARRKSLEQSFWDKVNKTGSCWLWTGNRLKAGYGQIKQRWPLRSSLLAHRVSWMIHRGEIPKGMWVLHNCPGGDNPRCVNPMHLYLGTIKENARDAIEKGQLKTGTNHHSFLKPESVLKGDRHPNCKLSESEVREIREQHRSGVRNKAIAQAFGIRRNYVCRIVSNEAWSHIL